LSSVDSRQALHQERRTWCQPSASGTLMALGFELLHEGRPDASCGALAAAIRAATFSGDGCVALQPLVLLLLDGSPSEAVRNSAIADAARYVDSYMSGLSSGDVPFGMVLALDLARRGLFGPAVRAAEDLHSSLTARSADEGSLDHALSALGMAVVRRSAGLPAPDAARATHLLLSRGDLGSPHVRRLVVRAALTAAADARRFSSGAQALNFASAAIGHARHLRGGWRTALLPQALTELGAVLTALGRHEEARDVEIGAIYAAVEESVASTSDSGSGTRGEG
jgi:hypothetical protein